MNRCPDDDVLRRFIESVLPTPESDQIEAHVEECVPCRVRLDVLAGVSEFGSLVASVPGRSQGESPSLLLAIKQLESESGITHASESITKSSVRLQSSSEPGSIGRLGTIDIRRVLGRGAMGVVYEGHDPVLNRTVAVKVLSPQYLGDALAKERFVREAQSAAALTHENVVAIHAIGNADDVPYLVLQYVAGESLADRLAREKKLSADEMARIGIQIARGLAAAHSVGLIHRDIKPANILVEAETGHIRLADFGLAKAIGGASITNDGVLAGTPAYMSPEQALALPPDARADLFSLGVVLYQGVAGELPFAGDSPFLVLDKIRRGVHKRLSEVDPKLPAWYCDIVDSLLAKDPDQRIASAEKVANALASRTRTPRPFTLRTKLASATAGVLLLIGLSTGVFAWLRESAAPSLPSNQEKPIRTGFLLRGHSDPFETLADAIAAATEDAVIEVHGDGPFPCSKIEVKNKRLTIRAGQGWRPVFMPAETNSPPTQNWITSDSELTLDGIDVDWPVGAGANLPITQEEGVIVAPSVTLMGCRIQSGNRGYCVIGSASVVIDRCYLLSDRAGGRCIGWKDGDHLKISRTICEAKIGIVIRSVAAPTPKIEIQDCTLRCETGFMGEILPSPTKLVEFSLRRTIFDTENVVCLLYNSPSIAKKMNTSFAKSTLQKLATWSEEENVYRRKANFLTTWGFQRQPISAEINSPEEWASYWGLPQAKSIAADIRFRPRPEGSKRTSPPVLDRLEQPTGPIPSVLGSLPGAH